jgi:SnoaL-like polyketide cyclase
MKYLVVIIFLFSLFFLVSCQQHKPAYPSNAVQNYLNAWNGGSLDSLNAITSENFQLRINPTFEAMTGRDKLKESISKTRYRFPDFSVKEKEIIVLGDTSFVITWVIKGTYKNPQDSINYGRKTEASGFSVIFFHDRILTGEWIAYSDLTWYKNLGYELVIPKKK